MLLDLSIGNYVSSSFAFYSSKSLSLVSYISKTKRKFLENMPIRNSNDRSFKLKNSKPKKSKNYSNKNKNLKK